jgi:hypothetical protein
MNRHKVPDTSGKNAGGIMLILVIGEGQVLSSDIPVDHDS